MVPGVQLPRSVLQIVADLRSRLHDCSGTELREIRVFGSFARGEAGVESDLDLLVVLTTDDIATRRIVYDLAGDLTAQYGICVSPTVFADERWRAAVRAGLPLARAIERDGVAA